MWLDAQLPLWDGEDMLRSRPSNLLFRFQNDT